VRLPNVKASRSKPTPAVAAAQGPRLGVRLIRGERPIGRNRNRLTPSLSLVGSTPAKALGIALTFSFYLKSVSSSCQTRTRPRNIVGVRITGDGKGGAQAVSGRQLECDRAQTQAVGYQGLRAIRPMICRQGEVSVSVESPRRQSFTAPGCETFPYSLIHRILRTPRKNRAPVHRGLKRELGDERGT
jgi:hypothetical protein